MIQPRRFPILLFAALMTSVAAWGLDREGSSWTDLQKLKPPPPSEVAVAVLPFWAKGHTQSEMARGSVLLNLRRHGFKLVPGATSVMDAAKATDKLVENDPDREPGSRLSRDLAVRVGKAVNATWVIYGEVEDLRTAVDQGFFVDRKTGVVDLRLVLASVDTGSIIYWTRVRDTWGSKVYARRGASIERRMACQTIGSIFEDINKALPPHRMGAQVSEDDIQAFVRDMGL